MHLRPKRRFDPNEPEMMDRPDSDEAMLREDLANLRALNRYFGGFAVLRKRIPPMIRMANGAGPVEILDLATGSADHPLALLSLARAWKRPLRMTVVDNNPRILRVARELTDHVSEITVLEHDIRRLPFADKSFDIVLCSLALHHLTEEEAVHVLGEMGRLSRVGLIVNDLHRTWLGAVTVWIFTRLMTRNPMTRNDAYLSILRGFTPGEMREMAERARLSRYRVERGRMFRLVLTAVHDRREE